MTASSARHRRARLVAAPPEPGPGGLQEAFVEELSRLKASDPLRPVTVLVGSDFLRLHLQRHLAVRLGGHANVSFLRLRDLARRLGAAHYLKAGRRRLPAAGRDLLLEETVRARAHGTYFNKIAATPGFIEALGATIRDLKDAGVEPVTLRAADSVAAKAAGSGGGPSGRKLADLADLFETYDDLLRDRRLYDEEDLTRAAGRAAAAATDPGREAAPVLVYGFYDANWQQRRLIQECLALAPGTVFLPYDASDPDDACAFSRPMLDWLASWIPERRELPGPRRPSGPEVRILAAPGEAREAVEAVRWLVTQARERSLPFGELGLVYRSAEPYRRLVSEAMEASGGVPHFLADGRPLAACRPARALLLLLRARQEGYTRRGVLDALASCGVEPTALWDRVSRQAGVVKGIEDWRARLRRLASGGARAPEREAARALLARVEGLHAALEALPGEGTWSAIAGAALDLLQEFVPEGARRDEVEATVAELGGLDDVASPAALGRFERVVRESLERRAAREEDESEFQRSGIFVGDVMLARLLQFQALAVVGLVEKGFPAPSRQDPILLDDERETVNRLLGEPRLALKSRRLDEERLLFRLARSAALEGLLLSYPRLDAATARPRLPSPFVLRAASEVEGRPIDYEALERLARWRRVGLAALAPDRPGESLFAREFDLGALRSAQARSSDSRLRKRVASFLHANPILSRALVAEAARWGEPRFTAHDGVILRPGVLESLQALHPVRGAPVSASRIEAYCACPLQYFLGQVLDLEPLEEPERAERLDPRRRGRLVHRILFDVYSELRERRALPLTVRHEAGALALLERSARRRFQQEDGEGLTGYPLLWEIDQEEIREDLATVLRSEARSADSAEWAPAHFELRYGMQRPEGDAEDGSGDDPASTSDPVPFEIAPGRRMALKGMIDRVDVSRDGDALRVTDYKTGRMSGYVEDGLAGGTSVQLPLYLTAAAHLLAGGGAGPRPAQARYLSVDRRGGFRSVGFDGEALERRRADLARVAAAFLDGVARGVFFAHPDPEICRWCDFQLACGEGREARFDRKKDDATAADYLRVRREVP